MVNLAFTCMTSVDEGWRLEEPRCGNKPGCFPRLSPIRSALTKEIIKAWHRSLRRNQTQCKYCKLNVLEGYHIGGGVGLIFGSFRILRHTVGGLKSRTNRTRVSQRNFLGLHSFWMNILLSYNFHKIKCSDTTKILAS